MPLVENLFMKLNHDAHDNSFDTIGEGTLVEIPGRPLCPVKTFQFKIILASFILTKNHYKRSQGKKFWSLQHYGFFSVPVGEKALGKKMATLSAKYSLSKRYTNHCVHVTSLQLIIDRQIPGRHIIRVSGHKSEGSVKSYAKKLLLPENGRFQTPLTKLQAYFATKTKPYQPNQVRNLQFVKSKLIWQSLNFTSVFAGKF